MPRNPVSQTPFPSEISLDGTQLITGTCSESTFVNVLTGNLMCRYSVVSVPTVGHPLSFYLTYNSQMAATPGPVGARWWHNYMMGLTFETGLVLLLDDTGRQYTFVDDGAGTYTLSQDSSFLPGTLEQVGSSWRITSTADASTLTFNSDGLLVAQADSHGNTTTLTYAQGRLRTIEEPTGRQILLGYTDTGVTVTDPRGNTTTLTLDASGNLVNIVSPEGCVIHYGYEDPSTHLITARSDAFATYQFEYDTVIVNRLARVTDPDGEWIAYSYDDSTNITSTSTNVEFLSDPGFDGGTPVGLPITRLRDARGKTWEYRFDLGGNLWRIIDPIQHNRHFRWDPEQRLVTEADGYRLESTSSQFPAGNEGPYDNLKNAFRRSIRDELGNLLYQADPTGVVTAWRYEDEHWPSRPTAVHVGQAHLGVQGNWAGQYGEEGFLLCAFGSSSEDVVSLPSYVEGIQADFVNEISRVHLSDWKQLQDPRVLTAPPDIAGKSLPDDLERNLGFWKGQGGSPTAFSFQVALNGARSFNLSLYTNSVDQAIFSSHPLIYNEQFGRDLRITVHDWDASFNPHSQVYRVYNNAPGFWVSFPVHGDATHPISVELTASREGTDPVISAIAFDPYESHETTFTYAPVTGDLLSVTDGLHNEVQMTYNADGTLATFHDLALGHEFQYAHGDLHKNLTFVADGGANPLLETRYGYDANGNMTEVRVGPLSSPHTTTMTHDDKNRLTSVTDALGHSISYEYDASGRLISVTDANAHVTHFAYTLTHRLARITDALGQETHFTWDSSGNLLSVQDARGNVYLYHWDDAERLDQITLPDGQTISLVHDVHDRLVAINSPNSNLSPQDVNLVNAFNWLKNAAVEEARPDDASRPRSWSSNHYQASLGDSRSHSPVHGLQLPAGGNRANYWTQQLDLPPGVSLLGRGWASSQLDGANVLNTACMSIWARNVRGVGDEAFSPDVVLPADGTWTPLPSWRFTADATASPQPSSLPGDAQHDLGTAEFRVYGSGNGSVWFDDLELYLLSQVAQYDKADRLVGTLAPDGTRGVFKRDRLGRVTGFIDPRGVEAGRIFYDGLDRPVRVVDANGQAIEYTYAGSNLTSLQDSRGSLTSYQHDPLNRLIAVVYPDLTTEQFSFDIHGNLATYTNNRSQVMTYAYDAADRLVSITYPDDTTVARTYDPVGNLLVQTDRNGDVTTCTYDPLNRVTGVARLHGTGSPSPSWSHQYRYDANGNRIALTGSQTRYGSGRFGQDLYSETIWSVPEQGYDAMDRLEEVQDGNGCTVQMSYDVEGRRTKVVHPSVPGLQTTTSYDVMGRLLSLRTEDATGTLWSAQYGYDAASNRLGIAMSDSTVDYGVDAAGQLVKEARNRFVEGVAGEFAQGVLSGVALDSQSRTVSMLPFSDSFAGSELDMDHWRAVFSARDYVGLELRQNDGLLFGFPRGYCNNVWEPAAAPPSSSIHGASSLPFGICANNVWAGVEHRLPLVGDFDVQVDFSRYQCLPDNDMYGAFGLMVHDAPLEQAMASSSSKVLVARNKYVSPAPPSPSLQGQGYRGLVVSNGAVVSDVNLLTTDLSGRLRLIRSGTTVEARYYDASSDTWPQITASTFTDGAVHVSLVFLAFDPSNLYNSVCACRFRNFLRTSPTGLYAVQATPSSAVSYTSAVYDAGRPVEWGHLHWDATLPVGTGLVFQVAVSGTPDPASWDFQGPFTTSGAVLSLSGRYARYRVCFTGDGSATAELQRVQLTYDEANGSVLVTHAYDGAGNMTRKVTLDATGTSIEVRDDESWPVADRINNLNQLKRNDVTPAGGPTTTWRYTYDLSGNMTAKTDGTSTWAYTWDEDNRLTLVTLPNAVTVGYTYDMMGRMLTRTHSVDGTTTFEWDGWDCVRETSPNGMVTRYIAPQGELLSFERGGETYQVHSDSIGSVRLVTGSDGVVAARLDYDAWGNVLSSSYDNVPGRTPYGFVGSLGCRADDSTDLAYMRHRWYDTTIGRFVSLDRVRTINRYGYARNNPGNLVDPLGLAPREPIDPYANQPSAVSNFFRNIMQAANILDPQYITIGPYGDPQSASTGTWSDPMGYVQKNGTLAEQTVFYGAVGALMLEALVIIGIQPGVSLVRLKALAIQNGVNLSNISLHYSYRACGAYGFTRFMQLANGQLANIVQGDGKTPVYLTRLGLSNMNTALRTLLHELKHIAEVAETGMTTEQAAIEAEEAIAGFTYAHNWLNSIVTKLSIVTGNSTTQSGPLR